MKVVLFGVLPRKRSKRQTALCCPVLQGIFHIGLLGMGIWVA